MPTVLCYVFCLTFVSGFDSHSPQPCFSYAVVNMCARLLGVGINYT